MKITDNPSNEEFWQFEGRIAVRANIGILHVAVPYVGFHPLPR